MARTEISIERFITEARQKLGEKNVLTGPDTENFDVDFWKQYRGQSACVLKPGSTNDVVEIVRLARKHNVTLVPQGGNTGLVNGGIPDLTGTQAIISLARMNHIRSLDPAGDYIIVEAGVILADLQKAALAADRQFPLSLGAEGSCRIGGNIATNAGGLNVLRYGMTRDLVLGLEIVLADGQILDLLKPLRKDNTGYDLKQLFIGSEGTLGIITAAALRLAAPIRERVTLWLAVEKTEHAIDLFRTLRGEFGDLISSFELISSYGVETACAQLHGIRRPTESTYPWHILIEIAWSFPSGLRDHAERIIGILFEKQNILDGTIAENEAQRAAMWRIREGQSEATSKIGEVVRSDVTVAIMNIPSLVSRCEAWVSEYGPDVTLLPFGHIGDGNLHMNFVVPREHAKQLAPQLLERLFQEVDHLEGSISAEHGVGKAKRDAIAQRKSKTTMNLMTQIKGILDPHGTLNPEVIVAKNPNISDI